MAVGNRVDHSEYMAITYRKTVVATARFMSILAGCRSGLSFSRSYCCGRAPQAADSPEPGYPRSPLHRGDDPRAEAGPSNMTAAPRSPPRVFALTTAVAQQPPAPGRGGRGPAQPPPQLTPEQKADYRKRRSTNSTRW